MSRTIKMGYEGPSYNSGYTGELMESELIGELKKLWDKDYYLSYRKSMDLARENCPYDPTDPDPRWANDVHAMVADSLGLEDYSKLKFYTGRHSPLDYKHGIDAFIEWEFQEGKNITVTMDLTTRPKGAYKAHLTVLIPREGLDPVDDREEFLRKVQQVAEQAVALLKKASKDEDISCTKLYLE